MNKREENMEWELEAPYLASLPKTTPFSVPDNYFKHFPSQVESAIFLEDLVKKEDLGFSIPTGYFEDLASNIESRIAVDTFANKEAAFTTPDNYFDKLNASILSKTIENKPKTKVRRLWGSDFMKYASAACFIILSATGLYLNQQNNLKLERSAELVNEQMLYDIDENVIIEHLNETQTASNLSNAEMENYILENYTSNDISTNL
ncbi:MAG: hypothetical protein EOO87_08285 [Pedobacter sp.]|nr:MAG: hypothetical protein EOO87_08285 [Pedobacter sp.]